jgi:acetyl-CoA synthetase
VIGTADELTGQAVHAFATLKPYVLSQFRRTLISLLTLDTSDFDVESDADLSKELILQVRKVIGPFAAPKKIYVVPDLPKTRSGKIMRRILRKIVDKQEDQLGDLSTLADPTIVEVLITNVKKTRK